MKCSNCGGVTVYSRGQRVCPKCILKDARRRRCNNCVFLDPNRLKYHCLFYKEGKQPPPEYCEFMVWSGI